MTDVATVTFWCHLQGLALHASSGLSQGEDDEQIGKSDWHVLCLTWSTTAMSVRIPEEILDIVRRAYILRIVHI